MIDGFDDSGFSGFSFLVLLVLALLVLGGGFSGFSSPTSWEVVFLVLVFLVLLVLPPKAIGIFEDNDTIFRFLSFLSFLYSINQPPTIQIIQRKKMPTTPFFLSSARIASTSPFIPTYPSRNIYYYSNNNNNNKQYTTEKKAAESPRSALLHGCYAARKVVVFFWRIEYQVTKDLVYSKNALLGVFGVATQIDYSS